MQRAKTFFYVSLGILALAVAFHFGARSAQSQAPSPIVAATQMATSGAANVFLENGDVWVWNGSNDFQGRFRGNVFGGDAPVQATETTWGRIKADRR